MYWHSWNEGICQTRSQKLARTSTRPLYNPVQITPVVSLKQGNKCTITLTAMQKSWKCPANPRQSPTKLYITSFPQIIKYPGLPKEKQKKVLLALPVAKKTVVMPKRWPASQATEGWKRTEQWKSQQVASCKKEKIFRVSNILMPSENKFNRVFPFLLYLFHEHLMVKLSAVCAFHISQAVCGSQPLLNTETKELREECFSRRNYQSWQGTKLSFGGHTVQHRQPGCSCQPVNAKHCSVREQNKIHCSQKAFRRPLTCTGRPDPIMWPAEPT